MYYITDEINNNSEVAAVFEEYHALLLSTITDVIDHLMKCFVEKKLFTTEEEKQITAITTVQEILGSLLLKVSSLLNDTRGFFVMLKVMKEYGNKGTKKLVDLMINRLNSLADKPGLSML